MASEFFRIIQEQSVNVVELSLPQHLDSGEFDRLNESLLALFGKQPGMGWVLDLSGLMYMGSSVLGLMVNVRQRVRDAGGRLALCGLSPRLLRIFPTRLLERLFVIKSDRADAVRGVWR